MYIYTEGGREWEKEGERESVCVSAEGCLVWARVPACAYTRQSGACMAPGDTSRVMCRVVSSSPIGRKSCIVKSFRASRSLISSPLWKP